MSPFVSRILVAAVGLPLALGVVWLGGWWLCLLAIAAGLIALHELYVMARPLRPLALAGYAGLALTLLGVQLGGPVWMIGGFLTTVAFAFLLKGVSETRQSLTVAVATTVLGVAWVGLGLAYLMLLRGLPEHGRLAIFTVLLAVFGADTFAFFTGRLIGRHKMAPVISPGKTWEGFVTGTAVCVFVTWVALYRTGFLEGWRSLVLGGALAVSSVLGDLFESALKRDVGVKDSGRLLAGHGGMLDRIDALLFAGATAYYVIAAFGAV
jgi:phosphatidate cytidylyltransferase